jgi:hypothetical protein
MSDDSPGEAVKQLKDGAVAAIDSVAIIGGLIAVLSAPDWRWGLAIALLIGGYFFWPRSVISQKWGPPLPWDKEGWKEYNGE